jgi:Xaa-Pro aminopeptidase
MAIIKTETEIGKLKRAARAGSAAFARVLPMIRSGVSERQIAELLEAFAQEVCGAAYGGLAFPPIIASGPNGAQPHAEPSDRVIEAGDFVTVDFGVIVEDYCSDMTRTFFVGGAEAPSADAGRAGPPSALLKGASAADALPAPVAEAAPTSASAPVRPAGKQIAVYNAVFAAQTAGVLAARPGIVCRDLDRVCRGIIEDAGFGEEFIHTTGHGVGTEVHENPRIGRDSEEILAAGMVVTIEPGIYIEGWGGVRIEDTVVVTKSGCEVITRGIAKELPV